MNGRDRRKRLDEIRKVADTLRSDPIDAPDFMNNILNRVDAERPFLARSVRRKLPLVYVGASVCVALAGLAIVLTHRFAPEPIELVASKAPITGVVRTVQTQADVKMRSWRDTVASVQQTEPTQLISALAVVAALDEPMHGVPGGEESISRLDTTLSGRATGRVTGRFVGPVMPLAKAIALESSADVQIPATDADAPVTVVHGGEVDRAGVVTINFSSPSREAFGQSTMDSSYIGMNWPSRLAVRSMADGTGGTNRLEMGSRFERPQQGMLMGGEASLRTAPVMIDHILESSGRR